MTIDGNTPFPALKDDSGETIRLSGRVVTVGSSAECRIRIRDRSVPGLACHFIFTQGTYHLHVLDDSVTVTVNGTATGGKTALAHGDVVAVGNRKYRYLEREVRDEAGASVNTGDPVSHIIGIMVGLLKNRDQDVSTDLVASVSRLLKCDAARLVAEGGQAEERKTIARYPADTGLERFSTRAIDWARDEGHTVVLHETDWQNETDSSHSLRKNLVASVLCGPLREESAIIGYLYLDRLRPGKPFDEADRRFFDSLLPFFSEILIVYSERRRQRETISRLQQASRDCGSGIIFESTAMAQVMATAGKLARTESPVLILGDTGTGKELLARFIHANSHRGEKTFKAINCGAISENLMESELFGHEKGAFTGAVGRKAGLFESAGGGTVFLDEIGELPMHLQVKLLRVLQEGEYTRVGGQQTLQADVRIIAATNKNLEQEVAENRFRQDLYFRLNVLTMVLPPLRQRGRDVVLLSEYCIKKYCQQFGLSEKRLSSAAENALLSHSWPGNVRELENVIQKAVLLSTGTALAPSDLNLPVPAGVPQDARPLTLNAARDAAEADAIRNALSMTRGNVSQASQPLDIDRKWLMKKMAEFGIEAESYRERKAV